MLAWPRAVMLWVDTRKMLFRDGDGVLGTHRIVPGSLQRRSSRSTL
jgi:hypothetical protein